MVVHARLVSSTPAEDDTLAASPPALRLVFSESIEAALSSVRVVSARGSAVVRVRADSMDARVLVGDLAPLPPGAYRVDWRIVSADGHPVEGSYGFTILDPSGPADSVFAPAPPLPARHVSSGHAHGGPNAPAGVSATLRGLALFALLVLAGWLVQLVALRGAPPAGAVRTALAFAAAAALLLIAHFAAWLWHVTPADAAPDLGAALQTVPGRVEAVRIGLALLAVWAIGLARRPWIALAFVLAAVLTSGAAGHSAGIAPGWSIPLKSLHLVAVAVWMGGVAWLALAALGPASFAASASRVSTLALASVALVGATGAAQAAIFLPDFSALSSSAYGRLVLAKLAGLAGLVAFGAHNRRRLLPRLAAGGDPGALRASTRRELALLLAVSLVAGALAYVPPPSS
ncbi:MAG TPA: copper resistance protein CopC [Gemmatimonadota bacterium]|nr:copper resistance protein CopC [Gemmatimonadota bacterium]